MCNPAVHDILAQAAGLLRNSSLVGSCNPEHTYVGDRSNADLKQPRHECLCSMPEEGPNEWYIMYYTAQTYPSNGRWAEVASSRSHQGLLWRLQQPARGHVDEPLWPLQRLYLWSRMTHHPSWCARLYSLGPYRCTCLRCLALCRCCSSRWSSCPRGSWMQVRHVPVPRMRPARQQQRQLLCSHPKRHPAYSTTEQEAQQ